MDSSSNVAIARAAAALGSVCCLLTGCYVLQSAQGQWSLMAGRQPIARVIERPDTPATLREQLREVTTIRDFATRELGLPDNGSYRSYADVGRPYVVWNVVAAPEFSVDPVRWCFPVVGCVAYRGYFVESRARRFAARLQKRGLDVSVGGVAAYSTLGHFDDPVLNTMVGWDDVDLAGTVFHELTHQLLYVRGDASFNEALATTVEEEGVKRWLLAQGRGADLERHEAQQRRILEVIDLLRRTGDALRQLYASPLEPDLMRARKRREFDALRAAHARLEENRRGPGPFDAWFRGDLNNAHLASIATYYDCVPGFRRELAAAGGDLATFYGRVRELAKLDRAARDAVVCATH